VQAVLSSTEVVMLVWALMATVASGETLTAATALRLSYTRLISKPAQEQILCLLQQCLRHIRICKQGIHH